MVHPSLSYCSSTCDVNLEYQTFGDHLNFMADKYPDRVAYIFHKNNDLHLTFWDVRKKATTLAKNLLRLSLKKSDRLAQLLPNTHG